MNDGQPDRRDGCRPPPTGRDPARDLYEAPATRWVAEFVGDINLFEGEVTSHEHHRLNGCDPGRRKHRRRGAASARYQDRRHGCGPPREGKAVAPRSGVGRGYSQAINRLEGVVTDVGYLGGSTVYKIKLDSGAVVRSSMANTARMDRDTYSVGQRVVAWFTPDDCMVLEQ